MDRERYRALLRESLEDHRLSRAERKSLRRAIEADGLDAGGRAWLRAEAFDLATASLSALTPPRMLKWLEGVVKVVERPLGRAKGKAAPELAAAWFSPGPDCLQAVVSELRSTRRSAAICVFTITDDRITRAILETAARGVQVRVLTDDDKGSDRGSDVERMARAGVDVAVDRGPAHMHHKFALLDERRLLTGSFNWTRSASSSNYENLLRTSDPLLLQAFGSEFERLWGRYTR